MALVSRRRARSGGSAHGRLRMGEATIRLSRAASYSPLLGMESYDIAVDGTTVGVIKAGESVEIAVTPGRHSLRLRGRNRSPLRALEVGDGEVVRYRCHGPRGGACAPRRCAAGGPHRMVRPSHRRPPRRPSGTLPDAPADLNAPPGVLSVARGDARSGWSVGCSSARSGDRAWTRRPGRAPPRASRCRGPSAPGPSSPRPAGRRVRS